MPDPAIGAVITRHIDELEASLRYANTSMQPLLAKAVAAVVEEKRHELGWAGEVPADFDETLWLAPAEWRMPGEPDHNDFYLSFSLGTTASIDGREPATWIGAMAGFAGATSRYVFGTDALGQRGWKSLLRSQSALLDELVDKGFLCDPKTGDLALTIPLKRDALADGFEEDGLNDALAPMGTGIDRIHTAQPVLDRLVEAIKAKASA